MFTCRFMGHRHESSDALGRVLGGRQGVEDGLKETSPSLRLSKTL
jgi:hypothetical protein